LYSCQLSGAHVSGGEAALARFAGYENGTARRRNVNDGRLGQARLNIRFEQKAKKIDQQWGNRRLEKKKSHRCETCEVSAHYRR
jgi:hypothetical protein